MPSEIMKVAGTDMVSNQTERNILLHDPSDNRYAASSQTLSRSALMVSTSKDGIHILNDTARRSRPIPVSMFFCIQLGVVAVTVIVKLGEYVVPYLHVTVTVTAYGTARFAAAVFLTAVIVNLRTGTAGTCAMLPEVIFFAETENTLCRAIPISLFQISNASSSS